MVEHEVFFPTNENEKREETSTYVYYYVLRIADIDNTWTLEKYKAKTFFYHMKGKWDNKNFNKVYSLLDVIW